MNRLAMLALAGAALALAGCGGGDKTSNIPDGSGDTAPTEAAATPTTETAPAASKPKVGKGKGKPPKKVEVIDLKKGKGTAAKDGDKLSMNYVGVLFDTGKEFDNSYDRGEPFQFTLGGGEVIPGWDKGIKGMKPGGRRKLIIPPADGYGAQGQPPDIPGDSTLVFIVDLVSVN